jgi:hypothetical protein
VSVATGGTTAAPARTVGDGIYLLNADQTDAVGQGDTARTGGLPFDPAGTGGTESPYRVIVGPDDRLYISDWSDSRGGLYVTDANVATNSIATNVLAGIGGTTPVTNNHGSVYAAHVEGSLANSDLVVYTGDEDLSPLNSLWQYSVGAGPLPFEGAGTLVSSAGITSVAQVAKVVRGPDGKWYKTQRRADNATTAGIFVVSADGTTTLWDSLTAWRDLTGNPGAFDVFFSEIRGVAVSPDGKYLVGLKGNTNSLNLLPLVDGIPNIANLVVTPTTPTTSIGRDIAFDAAGNIYTVSSGQGVLRIYSPGGFSVVTTGSDGSFNVFVPAVDVSIVGSDNVASETAGNNAEFTIGRASLDISQPLTVRFSVSGTATRGVDYVLQTNAVTLTTNAVVIPAGQSNVVVTLVPTDDTVAELTETATLSINATAAYTVAGVGATSTIDDNETPMIDVASALDSMFEQTTNDYVRFRLTRRGNTNETVSVNINYGGTAINGSDYSPNSPISIEGGVVEQTFDVHPLDDSIIESNETVTVSIASGTGYVIGTNGPALATGTILDDDVPTETILFSENFDIADSMTNWVVLFASTNLDDPDYTVTFAYDYAADVIPPAPHSGTDTHGVRIAANDGGVPTAVAVNLYPIGQSFSGNFALRFDMFLLVGTVATTEYALMGINHSGTATNWFRNTAGAVPAGWTFDGLFYGVESDGAALGDYVLYSSPTTTNNNPTALTPGRNASTLTNAFKVPPYAAVGAPSHLPGTATPSWVQVEISYIGDVVTLTMNNTEIFSYNNTNSAYNSGNIMLGYVDAFDSQGSPDAAVIYDNVRVISLDGIRITRIQTVGGNAVIDFTFSINDAPSAFALQTATAVNGPYANAGSATIIQVGPNTYRATVAQSGPTQFYRIKHQ